MKRLAAKKWALPLAAILLIGLGGALLGFVLAAPARTGFHTALFVLQALNAPFQAQTWLTPEPVREEVTYDRPGGVGVADIYRVPDGKRRAAVLIFLGANAAGRDDPDVVNLGDALARAGFVSMFHWSPTMGLRSNIDTTEIEKLVWAFQHLKSLEYVDRERLGMGGFSVGAAFALVAAADPRIRDEVVFLNAFGPYYDARDLMLQVSSRSSYFEDESSLWAPDKLTRRVMANELIEALSSPQDRELLTRRWLDGQDAPAAGSETSYQGLSADGVRALELLEGTTLERAERLYRELPESFREDMRRISPRAHLPGVKARLMIMHDRNDRLIPVSESRRLARDLESRGNYRYTELVAFDHVRPDADGAWQLVREGFKLYRHMYGIVRVTY